jgi:hypothetical protein
LKLWSLFIPEIVYSESPPPLLSPSLSLAKGKGPVGNEGVLSLVGFSLPTTLEAGSPPLLPKGKGTAATLLWQGLLATGKGRVREEGEGEGGGRNTTFSLARSANQPSFIKAKSINLKTLTKFVSIEYYPYHTKITKIVLTMIRDISSIKLTLKIGKENWWRKNIKYTSTNRHRVFS